MRIAPFALAAALAFTSAPASSYTAVSVANDTGFGYCNDFNNPADAEYCAFSLCTQYSNDPGSCDIDISSGNVGYYAVANGTGGWGWGYHAQSEGAAQEEALYQCYQWANDCDIRASWWEAYGGN